jgi:hypothetical protein
MHRKYAPHTNGLTLDFSQVNISGQKYTLLQRMLIATICRCYFERGP